MSSLLKTNHFLFRDMTELFMDAKSSATMLRENSAKYMLWFRLLFSQATSPHCKSAQKWLMALVAWWRLGLDKQACLCVSRPSPTTTLYFLSPIIATKYLSSATHALFLKSLNPWVFMKMATEYTCGIYATARQGACCQDTPHLIPLSALCVKKPVL